MKHQQNWNLLSKRRTEVMGFAILWIMSTHNSFNWPSSLPVYIVRRLFDYGNAGVELFLLASGVGLCYAWEKNPPIGTFYRRRLVRLLLPYLFIVVPYYVWRDIFMGLGSFWADVTQYNFLTKGDYTYWYIPAAAVFYLLFPAVYTYLNRTGDGKVSRNIKLAVLCVGTTGALYIFSKVFPGLYGNIEVGLTRFNIFFVGCWLAYRVQKSTPIKGWHVVAAFGWCGGYILLRELVTIQGFWYRILHAPFGFAVTVCLLWVLSLPLPKFVYGILRFFGERSVELYLSHLAIQRVFRVYCPNGLFDKYGVLLYAMICVLSIVFSCLLHPFLGRIGNVLCKPKRK